MKNSYHTFVVSVFFRQNVIPVGRSGRLSTAFCFCRSTICIYFSVCRVLEWPASEAAVFIPAPLSISIVMKVCRAQWNDMCLFIPAFLVQALMMRSARAWDGKVNINPFFSEVWSPMMRMALLLRLRNSTALPEWLDTFCWVMRSRFLEKSIFSYLSFFMSHHLRPLWQENRNARFIWELLHGDRANFSISDGVSISLVNA